MKKKYLLAGVIIALIVVFTTVSITGCNSKTTTQNKPEEKPVIEVKETPQNEKQTTPEILPDAEQTSTPEATPTITSVPTTSTTPVLNTPETKTNKDEVELVECPAVTVPSYFRFRGPNPDSAGVNTLIISETDMDRFKFSSPWELAKKIQVTCKELPDQKGIYDCTSFAIKKYKLDASMSIKTFEYLKFETFQMEGYDTKLDRDALSGNNVMRTNLKLSKAECSKWVPLNTQTENMIG